MLQKLAEKLLWKDILHKRKKVERYKKKLARKRSDFMINNSGFENSTTSTESTVVNGVDLKDKMEQTEFKADETIARMYRIDAKIDRINKQLDYMDSKLDDVNNIELDLVDIKNVFGKIYGQCEFVDVLIQNCTETKLVLYYGAVAEPIEKMCEELILPGHNRLLHVALPQSNYNGLTLYNESSCAHIHLLSNGAVYSNCFGDLYVIVNEDTDRLFIDIYDKSTQNRYTTPTLHYLGSE